MSERQVFISHASRDAELARALVRLLEEQGVTCWISGRDVAFGANYQEAIVGAISGARALVLLLTEAANGSDEVKKELSLASAQGIAVYPVRFDAVQPNAALRYELATRQWIEGGDVAVLAQRLATAIPDNGAPLLAAEAPAVLDLPGKPSVAVLPFANIGGDPEQEYFADGMTEEVITALSRIRAFFVIARNSSFTYKGRAVDARQVGRELGVRYVVEGSVRRGGNRVRITAQLADAATGTQLWADRFDGSIEDVFELQDQVATSLIGAIEPRILGAEIERAKRKPPGDLRAYDLMLQALPGLITFDRAKRDGSETLLRRALALEPDYALALARLAICIWGKITSGQLSDTAPARAEIGALVGQALATGMNDPEVLANAGYAFGVCHDLHAGIGLIEQALTLHPNSTTGLTLGAMLYSYTGQLAKVMDYVERAARLNPFEGAGLRNHAAAVAHFVNGQHERALEFVTLALRAWPGNSSALRYRTASLGLLGRIDEARQSAQELRAQMPALTVASARRHLEVNLNNAHQVPGTVDVFCEGLRRAGIPEG